MAVRPVLIDGATLWVEVDDEAVPLAAPQGGGGLVERGAVADRVRNMGDDIRGMLASVTRPVKDALEATKPEEWSIELNLGFKGEAGIPCLTKGEANGSVKISVKWKPAKG
ncbi:MAG: hypothetical protein EKK53_22390 [Burkholderiales bacterium]|nr:MAG: hypothetical protein EKK53_22390 [Burkholderiales bacterium]